MQTFLPYPDYAESAAVLDNKRLGKQRVESLQIFQALACRRLATHEIVVGPRGGAKKIELPRDQWTIVNTAVGWANHPATKMWTQALFELLEYQTAICNEWTSRGYVDTCLEKTEFLFLEVVDLMPTSATPRWRGNEHFHASHRANLLRKDPEHYGQFGWEESPDLDYVWP